MIRSGDSDRGGHLARLVMAVDFFERGPAVISVQRHKTKKGRPAPPVELMNQLEAYARVVYADEMNQRAERKPVQQPYSPEEKAKALALLAEKPPAIAARILGISPNTLKRWATAAGVPLINGHHVPDPPSPRWGSGQRTYGAARGKEPA